MLDKLQKDTREKAGRAIAAARELGNKIREAQAKGEPIGDLQVQFDKAHADATGFVADLNRIEQEMALEQQAAAFDRPAETFAIRQGDEPIVTEEFLPRRERQAREVFAKVGVRTKEDMTRFREAHMESLLNYVVHGYGAAQNVFAQAKFPARETMALLTTSGELGGFLAPDEFRAEVLKDMAGMAIIRGLARVESVGGPALVFPTIQSASSNADIYSTGYAGSWKSEGYVTGGTAPTVQNQPKFGQTRIPVHVWAPDAIELTSELLQDSKVNLDSILAEVIAETRALDEDAAFINGAGTDRPLGLLNTVGGTTITSVNSGAAAALTYGGLIDLFSNLPSQYRQNARWLMNSLTFGAILKLEDTEGHPVIPPNSIPGQLWGKPIAFSEFMPDIAATTKPILFGDFRFYGIADRQELRVQRLTEKFAPNLGILATARVGGAPLRTAAFRVQAVNA